MNTSREGLHQAKDGTFLIGNKFWGPLNQKKGGTLRRLGIYHRQRNKSSASHISSGHNKISQ